MYLDSASDIQANSYLQCKYKFLLYFLVGQDGIALPSNYKYYSSYLLIKNTIRYVSDKDITDADVQHAW